MGNGRRLKEDNPETLIVAAEPMQGELVQGLRSLDDGFIPPIIDISLLDRKIMVSNRDAIVWTRKLLDEEGIFAGVSSGAIARDRRPHRRGARRRQRRLPDPRRRLEVPLLRRLHEADRGDREPRLHRLVVARLERRRSRDRDRSRRVRSLACSAARPARGQARSGRHSLRLLRHPRRHRRAAGRRNSSAARSARRSGRSDEIGRPQLRDAADARGLRGSAPISIVTRCARRRDARARAFGARRRRRSLAVDWGPSGR